MGLTFDTGQLAVLDTTLCTVITGGGWRQTVEGVVPITSESATPSVAEDELAKDIGTLLATGLISRHPTTRAIGGWSYICFPHTSLDAALSASPLGIGLCPGNNTGV